MIDLADRLIDRLASIVIAAPIPDDDIGKAGPVGLFLILSLLIVVFLLGRSMRTHLRRVPLEFPDPAESTRRSDDGAAADSSESTSEDQARDGEIIGLDGDVQPSSATRRERPDTSHRDLP